jgi:transposase
VERRSRDVGPHFGLTPRKNQSGEIDITGSISKVGDRTVRTALYEATSVMLTRTVRISPLKSWAPGVAKRRGTKKAPVALARKLGVILQRMWVDGTSFRWTNDAAVTA